MSNRAWTEFVLEPLGVRPERLLAGLPSGLLGRRVVRKRHGAVLTAGAHELGRIRNLATPVRRPLPHPARCVLRGAGRGVARGADPRRARGGGSRVGGPDLGYGECQSQAGSATARTASGRPRRCLESAGGHALGAQFKEARRRIRVARSRTGRRGGAAAPGRVHAARTRREPALRVR